MKVGSPLIIAEMSGNHNQSLDRALAIVDAIAESGVTALKLQTYTADTMTIPAKDNDFLIQDSNSLWDGKNLHDLYNEAYTPWEWHKEIFERCKQKGLVAFSTPFDETAVDFLETLNVPMYKIASFENNHLPLIKKVAQTQKPMIISTGMATLSELEDMVNAARDNGCNDLTLLKCTSTYPASPENSNLLTIPHLKELFDVKVGVSDHTLGIGVAISSIALGAEVIEKHVTLSRNDGGVDAEFSMEPNEMKQLVEEVNRATLALGKVYYGVSNKQEEKSKIFRRSIYAVNDIKKGELFTSENIRIIRPSAGLMPKYYDQVLTLKATVEIKAGTPLNWNMVK